MVTIPFMQFKTALAILRKTAHKENRWDLTGSDRIRLSLEKGYLCLETDDGECHGICYIQAEGELEKLTVPIQEVLAALRQVPAKKGDITFEEVVSQKKGHPLLRMTTPAGAVDLEIEDVGTTPHSRREFPSKPRLYGESTEVTYQADSQFVEALDFLLAAEGDRMKQRGFARGIIFDGEQMSVTDGSRAHLEIGTPTLVAERALCPMSAFIAISELLHAGTPEMLHIKHYPNLKRGALFFFEASAITEWGRLSLALYAEQGKEPPPQLDVIRAKMPVTPETSTGIICKTVDLEAAIHEICHAHRQADSGVNAPFDLLLEGDNLRYQTEVEEKVPAIGGEEPPPNKIVNIGGFIPCQAFYTPYPIKLTLNARFLRQAMKNIGEKTHFVFWHPVRAASESFYVYGDRPGRLAILMPMQGEFFEDLQEEEESALMPNEVIDNAGPEEVQG